MRLICGVDEAGRGPLAGPVYAAAVILHPRRPIDDLDDSKRLSARRRDELETVIMRQAHAWAVGVATVEEIDRINILQASLLAMRRAIDALDVQPDEILVDGLQLPRLSIPATLRAIVGGDASVPAISAASILAKTARDRELIALHERYPQYGFDRHKGYPTAEHLAALQLHGPSPVHRSSFAPVRQLLLWSS